MKPPAMSTTLAERYRAAREASGYTQEAVSEYLIQTFPRSRELRLPGDKLSKWETGKVHKAPSVDLRIALAQAYGVTLTELEDEEALIEWRTKSDLLARTPAWDCQAA